MKEIKWESTFPNHVHGNLGCVHLHCRRSETETRKKRWCGRAYIIGLNTYVPNGPLRHSLAKAKEDCICQAREIMLNFREGVIEELKNFDLLMEQE